MEQIEALYAEHGSDLLRYLQRVFGHAASSEDLLQETFVRALLGWRRMSEAVSARAWLFGIARNVGREAARRRRPEMLPSDVAAPAESPADERLDRVRAAMVMLPEEQREALELRLTAGLSYEEIASVTGVPVGTVRSRLHYAVRRLRDAVTDRSGE